MLSDFRGEIRPSTGKPDYLRRHLDRVELATANLKAVAGYLKLPRAHLESHMVFRNPVPMAFALDHLKSRVTLSIFDKLEAFKL